MKKKVMVGMSGGVDSSIAALRLVEQGYDVIGVTLKLFSNKDIGLDSISRTCCSLEDVEDARSVANKLGFEHFVFNFGELFKYKVIDLFAASYLKGETPNPCINCNQFIKFEKMLERALLLELDFIATGHYARIELDEKGGRYLLKKAVDKAKDQTYVLYTMTQEQLKRTIFPLGGMQKSEVRDLAESFGFINAAKPDSQDICFVKNADYADFLKNTLNIVSPPGNFIDSSGNIIGTHRGLIHYTVGQRKGLNISFDKPKYIIKKDAKTNTVVLGDESELYCENMIVGDINLIAIENLKQPVKAAVKIRYSQNEVPAKIYPLQNNQVYVRFDEPQRAITPGQAAVFYDGESVIGGGVILPTVNI
jgi:tRNA-specific 2-thiouridylase